jgi:hypothetical protein
MLAASDRVVVLLACLAAPLAEAAELDEAWSSIHRKTQQESAFQMRVARALC